MANSTLSEKTTAYLKGRLVKCGDLLADGDLDPAFEREVRKEYRSILRALGYEDEHKKIVRQRRAAAINEVMAAVVKNQTCTLCNGPIKQTRKGSKRARCTDCGALFQCIK